jgi:hypothetical protein
MRVGRHAVWPALLFAALLAACASPIDVSVKGGSASDTKWRVGVPF